MSKQLRLVILGVMGQSPFAGVAWQLLHFLEGLRRLGHDVHYVEDTRDWPYDPEQDRVTDDCRYTVSYLARLMGWCGLTDRWAYRAGAQNGRIYGLSESQFKRVFEQADALINVTASTWLREEHLPVPIRVYVETDPVLPQIAVAQGCSSTVELLSAHTHLFTYAENLGAQDCGVPSGPFRYQPTRQPVILDWWRSETCRPASANGGRFTTVASWQQSGKDVEWNGEVYTWSKHHEFLKFVDLPRRAAQPLELALACGDEVIRLLTSHGWRIVDALPLSKDILPYRDYILGSRGEFTVAKDQNIRLRSGWFSDRSACYLAAGLPVITQDTGFGKVLPTGEGLFAFNTMEEILSAFDAIHSDYEKHRRAAQAIAQEYFRAQTVLAKLLDDLGL